MKFVIVFISICLQSCLSEVVVNTNYGKIRGKVRKDRVGGNFFSFQSVPYAKPPVNELRFKAPVPVTPWDGVLDGTKDVPECFQKQNGVIGGQEDCLYLNVYTKKIGHKNKGELLPVMVYIHGGAYIEGSAKENFLGPGYLLVQDIVLVVINYRLGIFGFLSFEDQSSGVPGNAGLKDQVQALKWVKENIESFGGNPNNVTIFGESAGGASVHHHILSPMSAGLFHRAIFQSGTAISSWNYGILGTGNLLAKAAGIKGPDVRTILHLLKDIPTEKIFEYQEKLFSAASIYDRFYSSPVVEKQTSELAFLPDLPINILRSGNYNHVPIITGYTSLEGIIFYIMPHLTSKTSRTEIKLDEMVPFDLNITENSKEIRRDVVNQLRTFYFGDKNPEDKLAYTKLLSDIYFVYPGLRTVEEHVRNLGKPLYLYRFSAETKLNFLKKLNNETALYPGASHVEDLPYLFNISTVEEVQKGSVEEKCVERMVKLWTDFAKSGDPTPDLVGVKWAPVKEGRFDYLDIGTNGISMGINPDEGGYNFWRDLYKTYTPK